VRIARRILDLLISGYGTNKIIVLAGDSAGTGEFAGGITNPHCMVTD